MPQPADLVHGWVSTDCGRGTIDVIWSCLFTIFICVWTTIHLPVPHYTGQWPLGLRAKIVRSKIVPALIALVAPEFLTITALFELYQAVVTVKNFRDLGGTRLCLTTGFFYNMGGFCLKSPSGRFCQPTTHNLDQCLVQRSQAVVLKEIGSVSEDQVNDSAGSDTLTKGIACVQVIWFVTQVVSRLCQHDSVTLLEISTTAYVLCAITSYIAWWKKPQGCTLPIFILCEEGALPPTSAYMNAKGTWKEFVWGCKEWWTVDYATKYNTSVTSIFLALTPLVFGAVHVASWNVLLPSAPELWLWRASTIYCSAAGLLAVLVSGNRSDAAIIFSLMVIVPLYCIIRVYMIVEVCISLRALPRSAYNSVQWSAFVPHI